MSAFAEIPPSITPDQPNFVQVVNDRLRRLAQSISGSGSPGSGGSGSTATRATTNYVNVTMDGSRHFTIDLSQGDCFRIVLSAATASGMPLATSATVLAPISTGGTIAASDTFRLYVDQDPTTGGWVAPAFASGSGGFASDVPTQSIDGTPNTRTCYVFTYHGSVWCLDQDIRTGGAVA